MRYSVSYCYSRSPHFLVNTFLSSILSALPWMYASRFLAFHTFTPQTSIYIPTYLYTYLYLEYSDSVAVFPVQGPERRPFEYMRQMILVFIQKTRQTTSPSCIKAHVAGASQQLAGILNREGLKHLWEFKKMAPARCLLHHFKQSNRKNPIMQNSNVAFGHQTPDSSGLFQQDGYPPSPC